jgi:putative RNA 2'-phosphotransferase
VKKASNDSLSKFLSLILRHHPEAAYIQLDEHGWAEVDQLISGIKKSGEKNQ